MSMTNLRDSQPSHSGLGSVKQQLRAGVPAPRVERLLLSLVDLSNATKEVGDECTV